MIYYPDNNYFANPDEEEEEEWDREAFLDPMWEIIQKKTFTAWCNSHLRKGNYAISDIENDLRDGRHLIYLLETLSGEQLFKPDKGNMRFHNIANVNKGLSYIESKGVQLISIGAEEIVDGNVKMTLGMIWSIILRFAIQDITVEEQTAKEGLLLWCKRKTAPYNNTNVQNFHFSWKDGLAFCALIHRHRPELIDYAKLSKDNPIHNLNYAFEVAEKYLDIPKMLDAEDMVNTIKPDERSVMAYVSSYYHAFAGAQKAETAANRICKVLQINQDNERLMNKYETLASDLLEWINEKLPLVKNKTHSGDLPGALAKLDEFQKYRGAEKPPKFEQKGELETTFNTLQTRLRLSNRPAYMPTEGRLVSDIQNAWQDLDNNEKEFADWLIGDIKRLQRLENLLKKFDLKCSTHEDWSKDKEDLVKPRDYKSLGYCELKKLLKRLEAFETDLGAHQCRVEKIVSIAEELNTLGYDKIKSINDRTQNVANEWEALGEATTKTRAELTAALGIAEQLDKLHLEFAKRVSPFINWVEQAQEDLQDAFVIHNLDEIMNLLGGHETFKKALPNAERELGEIQRLNDNIRLLVQNNGLPESAIVNPYTSTVIEKLQSDWSKLRELIPARDNELQSELSRQQQVDQLGRQFATQANQLGPWLEKQTRDVGIILSGGNVPTQHNNAPQHNINQHHQHKGGSLYQPQNKRAQAPIQQRGGGYMNSTPTTGAPAMGFDSQLAKLTDIEQILSKERPKMDSLEQLNKSILEKSPLTVEYKSPHTRYNMADLRVMYEQLLNNVRQSMNELENQILVRDTKGFSQTQLTEFKRCFNHFDKSRSKKLEPNDFKACLVSLGFKNLGGSDPEQFHKVMRRVDPGNLGYVTYNAFLDYVTKETGDQDNMEQLAKSFATLANDQPFITRDILERELPPNQAEYCLSNMPEYHGEDKVQGALDYRLFSNQLYGESEL